MSKPHEHSELSADRLLLATGGLPFADDHVQRLDMLEVLPICADAVRGNIKLIDSSETEACDGIVCVLDHKDIWSGGQQRIFPKSEVTFAGQIVAAVVGTDIDICRAAAAKMVVEIEETEVPSEENSSASFCEIVSGEPDVAFEHAEKTIAGEITIPMLKSTPGEAAVAWAEPNREGGMAIHTAAGNLDEIQSAVTRLLGLDMPLVQVAASRVGGECSTRDRQSLDFALVAALASVKIGCSARVSFGNGVFADDDVPPLQATYKAAIDDIGYLLAVEIEIGHANGGALDPELAQRVLLHADSVYSAPHWKLRARTTAGSCASTVDQSFADAIGSLIIESVIADLADDQQDQAAAGEMRLANFYPTEGTGSKTPSGQCPGPHRLFRIWHELARSSNLQRRREEISEWNASHDFVKRSIVQIPAKTGVGSLVQERNRTSARVMLRRDGSLEVSLSLVEMTPGVYERILSEAADAMGIDLHQVHLVETSTAIADGAVQVLGANACVLGVIAVRDACHQLKEKLWPAAAALLKDEQSPLPSRYDIIYAKGRVFRGSRQSASVSFGDLARMAGESGLIAGAVGHGRLGMTYWDAESGRGKPFADFVFGAAVVELEIDVFTGRWSLLNADLLADIGNSPTAMSGPASLRDGFLRGLRWISAVHRPAGVEPSVCVSVTGEIRVDVVKAQGASSLTSVKNASDIGMALAVSVREALRMAIGNFSEDAIEALADIAPWIPNLR